MKKNLHLCKILEAMIINIISVGYISFYFHTSKIFKVIIVIASPSLYIYIYIYKYLWFNERIFGRRFKHKNARNNLHHDESSPTFSTFGRLHR